MSELSAGTRGLGTLRELGTLRGLGNLLPDGVNLVASCFDAQHTLGGGLFNIGDTVEEIDSVSTTGLYVDDGMLFRCLWSADGSPAELIAYDETGVRRYHRLDDVSTPHDILVVDGRVMVVATTQNEVQCVAPSGEIIWRWRAPGEADSWHLNSLARYEDRVVVCGFGPFLRRRGWDLQGKPATGRVVHLDTGEPVLDGLRAPHNPHYEDGMWLVCDSAAGEAGGDPGRHPASVPATEAARLAARPRRDGPVPLCRDQPAPPCPVLYRQHGLHRTARPPQTARPPRTARPWPWWTVPPGACSAWWTFRHARCTRWCSRPRH